MSGGGSVSRNTSRNSSGPWSGTQPYLRDIYGQAQQQYYNDGPRTYYDGQTYANLNPTQVQANQMDIAKAGQAVGGGATQNMYANMQNPMTMDSAMNMASTPAGGSGGLTGSAEDQIKATIRGDNLGSNPYLDSQFDHASEAVSRKFKESTMPGISSTFGGAGRTGSAMQGAAMGDAQRELGGQLSGMASDIYGGAYEKERQRQADAAQYGAQHGLATRQANLADRQLGANMYDNAQSRALQAGNQSTGLMALQEQMTQDRIDRMRAAGDQAQGQDQRRIDEQMDRHYFDQDEPGNALARYAAIIEGLQQQSSSGKSSGWSTSGYGGMSK